MFDYTCITTIQEYLKRAFPAAFVRGFAGAIVRYGDAHVFEVGETDDTVTLTVAHRFLAEQARDIAAFFDQNGIPERLRGDGWVVVRADGRVEAFDRRRVQSYAGPMKLGQMRARRLP